MGFFFSQNPNPSPVMHQLHCLLKRSMFDLDLFSITDFVDGHINRLVHVLLSRFYPDFIQIFKKLTLSRFYLIF